MNPLYIFVKEVNNDCKNQMVKNVMGGGTQNLEDKREKRIDKR